MAIEIDLSGRVAFVTGGSRGLGRADALTLARAGADVVVADLLVESQLSEETDRYGALATVARQQGLVHTEETVREIEAMGRRALAVRCDVTNRAEVDAAVARTVAELGSVDILVNNAGQMYSGRFAAIRDDEMQTQLDTKLFGFLRAIRAVYPMMKAQKWGRIVNTIGGAGKEPDPYMFGSGITNSSLLNVTKSLATEFGEDNVLVNAVCPGWVDTNLWRRNAGGLAAELGAPSEEEARRRAALKNSLNRFGKPEELANAIVFLCSERASYITGVSLNLDGGRLKALW
jgi:3-oxoacyl-[acyl-carrier protein] reductase